MRGIGILLLFCFVCLLIRAGQDEQKKRVMISDGGENAKLGKCSKTLLRGRSRVISRVKQGHPYHPYHVVDVQEGRNQNSDFRFFADVTKSVDLYVMLL